MGKITRIVLCIIFFALGLGIIIGSGFFFLAIVDLLYLTLFIVCPEACILISIITGIEDTVIPEIEGTHKVAYIRKSVWLKSNIIWLVVGFWIISSSFLATLIVIYLTSNEENKNRIIFHSIMSLFTSIMSYVLNPIPMAKGYRLAYQEIDKAIFEFQEKGSKNGEILVSSLAKGEEYISQYSYDIKIK